MSSIEYGSGSDFMAPVMRIDDQDHGFKGVVFDASTRQSTDFDTGRKKWFRNRSVVLADEPRDGDQPVLDYIFHIAVEIGAGAFTERDADGEAVKLTSGKNKLEVRKVEKEDVAVVFSAAWMTRAAKSVKLNTGHVVRFKRTTPARDESGDRMTSVDCEIEILGKVDDPQRYNPIAGGVDYDGGADDFGTGPSTEEPVAAGVASDLF